MAFTQPVRHESHLLVPSQTRHQTISRNRSESIPISHRPTRLAIVLVVVFVFRSPPPPRLRSLELCGRGLRFKRVNKRCLTAIDGTPRVVCCRRDKRRGEDKQGTIRLSRVFCARADQFPQYYIVSSCTHPVHGFNRLPKLPDRIMSICTFAPYAWVRSRTYRCFRTLQVGSCHTRTVVADSVPLHVPSAKATHLSHITFIRHTNSVKFRSCFHGVAACHP